ncbi:MAG: hypothetical protein A4E52_00803 [Pelotomaculum sp. PtaB.Bin013]|uniref:Uncharacterized protein n=1 Tax=Pelotomaculum isophthalicicum JI TaxID=947010 RepID=A0A9X4JUQ5_9FIRM|nr:hypothetical protein [Pelotomaculum isophthalicicum]MDF9409670.1 hypothetical protein [Pelotomaculum isophthalicicum JI]OPX90494.1 MAG: hypothetical protein A4E52_00803 [Pelotomaculum sp. PtaB.Bin013]
MILDFIKTPLSGDAWEELCDACYRMRYQSDNYQKIPATYGGDAGIEGYTQTGIVYQCYYPERDYNDDELYEHQRNKLTKDINKLIDQENKQRLHNLGVPIIKQWHFVIPFYKDSRILQHAIAKRNEILKGKSSKPQEYDHLHDDFLIAIKVAEDFKVEISKIIRETITDTKLNVVAKSFDTIPWDKCPSEKVHNIQRKIKAVMNPLNDNDEDFNDVVGAYVTYYIKGIEVLRMLQADFPEIYEHIYTLEQACKREVSIKTKMNQDRSLNINIFMEILSEFEQKLSYEFSKYFTSSSIMELKHDMVGAWLADCPMEFRSG